MTMGWKCLFCSHHRQIKAVTHMNDTLPSTVRRDLVQLNVIQDAYPQTRVASCCLHTLTDMHRRCGKLPLAAEKSSERVHQRM